MTPPPTEPHDSTTGLWRHRLQALLDGSYAAGADPLEAGAEIVVLAAGRELERHGLARHMRVGGALHSDPPDPAADVCWIRPLVGGYTPTGPASPAYAFHLDQARRRGLPLDSVDLQPAAEPFERPETGPAGGRDVVFTLDGGLAVRVQPARGPQLAEIRRWDDFTITVLDGPTEDALGLLDDDGLWALWA